MTGRRRTATPASTGADANGPRAGAFARGGRARNRRTGERARRTPGPGEKTACDGREGSGSGNAAAFVRIGRALRRAGGQAGWRRLLRRAGGQAGRRRSAGGGIDLSHLVSVRIYRKDITPGIHVGTAGAHVGSMGCARGVHVTGLYGSTRNARPVI